MVRHSAHGSESPLFFSKQAKRQARQGKDLLMYVDGEPISGYDDIAGFVVHAG